MQQPHIDLRRYIRAIAAKQLMSLYGKVTKVVGLVVEAEGITAPVGELCHILTEASYTGAQSRMQAEVVGFDGEKLLLMPLGELRGIRPSDRVVLTNTSLSVRVGDELLGRVVDALGNPIDGGGDVLALETYPVHNSPPNCYGRRRITETLSTGIRAIDGLLTIGKGQRVGIFAGSGVGKSTLLGMIARFTNADVNVIALIGERGREVREFIEDSLGDGLSKSVVVAVTSDQSPLLRVQGALTATAIAEYFRARGKHVMLMMDSVTRFAMAQREIGLSIGEPPTTRGYTPSVFAKMPMLMERAGTTDGDGSITGLYTILVEGDDMNEPIADTARSILDGHIVLSRTIAAQNHYPAIDISNSLSRLMPEITSTEHQQLSRRFRQVLADYEAIRDAYNIGAYTVGMNPRSDYALQHIDAMNQFLRQGVEKSAFEETAIQLVNTFTDADSPSAG
ncbi:MAG: FliI/YscN family ATPase [Candidatus Poribacteria bacterium]|nr:FliI/YscN family ATPase [Candidatus Poribacteria bacterium]